MAIVLRASHVQALLDRTTVYSGQSGLFNLRLQAGHFLPFLLLPLLLWTTVEALFPGQPSRRPRHMWFDALPPLFLDEINLREYLRGGGRNRISRQNIIDVSA